MKKIIRFGLAAALLATGSTAANAQITFGPKVGFGLASQKYEYTGSSQAAKDEAKEFSDNQKMIVTPSFGLMLNARFGNLAVQPALTFAQKGAKVEVSNSGATIKSTARLNYVDIPVNLVYTTGGDQGFQVFAGPYMGLGIGGKVKTEISGTGLIDGTTDSDVEFASKEGTDSKKSYLRNPDFGINAGIGYLVNNLQLQAGYGFGLSNLEPDDNDGTKTDYKSQNRVIHFTVGYLFGN